MSSMFKRPTCNRTGDCANIGMFIRLHPKTLQPQPLTFTKAMQRTTQLITLLFCIALLGACAQGNGLYQYTCADGQPCPSPDSGLDDKTPPPAPPAPLNAQSQPSAVDASTLTDASAAKSDAATNSQNFPEVTLDQNNLEDTDSLSGSGNADDDNVNEAASLAGSSAGGSTGSTGDTSSSGGFGGLFGHGTLFGGTGGIADVIASIGGMFGGTGGIFGQDDTSNGDGSGGNGGIFSWLDGGTGGNAGGAAGLDGGLSSGGSGNVDAGGEEGSAASVIYSEVYSCGDTPVVFDLPEGWRRMWWDEGCLYHMQTDITPREDQPDDTVYLEVTLIDYENKSAEQLAEEFFMMASSATEPELVYECNYDAFCQLEPTYTEHLLGSIPAFFVSSRSTFGGYGSWWTIAWFEKDEHLYQLTLRDHIDHHLDAVAHVIETLRLSGE